MINPRTRQSADELLHLARKAGIPVSFDVNIRLKLATLQDWQKTLRTILPYVTWLFLGDSEAISLYGTNDIVTLREKLCSENYSGTGIVLKRISDVAGCAKSIRRQRRGYKVKQIILRRNLQIDLNLQVNCNRCKACLLLIFIFLPNSIPEYPNRTYLASNDAPEFVVAACDAYNAVSQIVLEVFMPFSFLLWRFSLSCQLSLQLMFAITILNIMKNMNLSMK